MRDLINEYRDALRSVRKLQETACDEDKSILSGIVSDLQYALEWMTTGRKPDNKRGIERRAAYQRERPFDPVLLQRYFRSSKEDIYEWDDHKEESLVTPWELEKIEDALSVLTEKEKEVYLMSRGHCLSYSQIANHLCISSSSVQTMIMRSEKKILKQIKESLFCLCG